MSKYIAIYTRYDKNDYKLDSVFTNPHTAKVQANSFRGMEFSVLEQEFDSISQVAETLSGKIYPIGAKIVLDGDKYIIARTSKNSFSLISLGSGNRWADPVTISNVKDFLTEDQVKNIINDDDYDFEIVG